MDSRPPPINSASVAANVDIAAADPPAYPTVAPTNTLADAPVDVPDTTADSSESSTVSFEIQVDTDTILLFIITLLTFLVIDITFIYMVTGPMFGRMVPEIQGSPLNLKLFPGFLTYLIMAISLFYFVIYPKGDLSQLDSTDYMSAFVLGLSIFAAFDLTNLAIFDRYSPYVAAFDIAWGSTLFVLTTFVTSLVYSQLKN